jgi:hypothetical protein
MIGILALIELKSANLYCNYYQISLIIVNSCFLKLPKYFHKVLIFQLTHRKILNNNDTKVGLQELFASFMKVILFY